MNVVFLGLPVPVDTIDEHDPRCHFAKVGALAQINILRGIKKDKRNQLAIITASPSGKRCELDLGGGMKARAVSNLHVKSFSAFLASLIPTNTARLFGELRKIRKQKRSERTVVITLSTAMPFSIPILLARFFHRGLIWCPFLVDSIETPHYTNLPFRLASKFSVWAAKRADASITFNIPSATDYIPDKPYLELFFSVDKRGMELYKKYHQPKNEKFTIVYVGALTDIYNFQAITEVIQETGKQHRWIFAGYGPNEEKIKKLVKDSRYDVEYRGVLPYYDAIKLQKTADLLLCLRLSDGTKANVYSAVYAASGKLSEYLCSGRPILSSDIRAISPQFKPYLNFVKDSSARELKQAIKNIILHYPDKLKLAEEGQRFAFDACCAQYQGRAANNFLKNLTIEK